MLFASLALRSGPLSAPGYNFNLLW